MVPSTGGRLLYTLSQLRGPIIPGVKLGSIILFSGFFIWPILSGPAVYTDHSLVGPDLYFGFYFTPSSTTSPTISSPSSPSSFDHQVSSPSKGRGNLSTSPSSSRPAAGTATLAELVCRPAAVFSRPTAWFATRHLFVLQGYSN